MANRKGGDNIRDISKGTQVKKGQKLNPEGKNQWELRRQLQWAVCQEYDGTSEETIKESFIQKRKERAVKGKHPINGTRLFALRAFERMIMSMDPTMFGQFINQTEGNLTQIIKHGEDLPIPENPKDLKEASRTFRARGQDAK